MKTTLKLLAGGMTLVIALAAPAIGQVFTLDSVLHLVDQRNPQLQEFDHRVKGQEAYAAGARGWMAPMVGIGTFMTPYPGQNVGEGNRGNLMLSFEQSIPNPAKLSANERYYASRAAVEAQGRSRQYNAVRAEAKSAYYRWLVAEEKLNILRESDRILEMMLKIARIRYPYNQGSLGSIYKTEGRQQEVRNMMFMTRGEIGESAATLRSLMDLPVDTPIAVDTTLQVTFAASALAEDTVGLAAQRSDVRQLEKSIEVMRLQQELQQYQAKPDFRLRFDHMQPLESGMPVMFSAMAMVSIPIAPWSSKMYRSEVNGMGHDIDAMKRGKQAILVETRGMLAGMAFQLERMQQQLKNYKERIIPALEKNYQATRVAYEENREQLPAVIDSWEALNMSRLAYTDKLAEYYQMIVRYEKEVER